MWSTQDVALRQWIRLNVCLPKAPHSSWPCSFTRACFWHQPALWNIDIVNLVVCIIISTPDSRAIARPSPQRPFAMCDLTFRDSIYRDIWASYNRFERRKYFPIRHHLCLGLGYSNESKWAKKINRWPASLHESHPSSCQVNDRANDRLPGPHVAIQLPIYG